MKVRALTGVYNLQDEVLEDIIEEGEILEPVHPVAVVQPALEVIVTDQQCTMTFNNEQVHICEQIEIDNSSSNANI